MMTSMSGIIKYYSFCCLFYFVFVMWLPLSHSDWRWHSDYGVQLLQNHFVDINGRYLSNILEFYAVRYEAIRWFSYSFISLFLVIAVVRFVTAKHRGLYFMLAFGLLLIIPPSLFKYSYGWFEGFYNYVPATACMIYILWYVTTVFNNFSTLRKKHHAIFYSVCLSGQLLLEQVTLFNILCILSALIMYGIKYKRLNPKLTLGFILTLIGAFIMYVNTSYDRLNYLIKMPRSSNAYIELVVRSYQNLTITINKGLFFNNIIILTLIALVLLMLLIQSSAFQNINTWKRVVITSGLLIFQCYVIIFYQSFNFKQYEHFIVLNIINFIVALMFLISVVWAINYLEIAQHVKQTLHILSGALVFTMISLSFYRQIEHGYFFITYVIWIVILLILLSQLEIERQWVKVAISSCVTVICCVFIVTIFYVDYMNDTRIGQLKYDYNHDPFATSYKVERLPFEQFLRQATPMTKQYEKLFKQYWNIPQDISIKFVPYNSVHRDDL